MPEIRPKRCTLAGPGGCWNAARRAPPPPPPLHRNTAPVPMRGILRRTGAKASLQRPLQGQRSRSQSTTAQVPPAAAPAPGWLRKRAIRAAQATVPNPRVHPSARHLRQRCRLPFPTPGQVPPPRPAQPRGPARAPPFPFRVFTLQLPLLAMPCVSP